MTALVQPPSSADAHYTHTQTVAATDWTVTHNLGKRVSVTVVDSADSVVIGDVEYIDDDTVALHFSAPFGGAAYCN